MHKYTTEFYKNGNRYRVYTHKYEHYWKTVVHRIEPDSRPLEIESQTFKSKTDALEFHTSMILILG